MTILDDNYSRTVLDLAKPGEDIVATLTATDAHLLHMALGVAGEAGELVDAIKKPVIYRQPIDYKNVVEELGDLEFYMEGLRQHLGITRDEVLKVNMKKLAKRYPGFRYTNANAQERADKKDPSHEG